MPFSNFSKNISTHYEFDVLFLFVNLDVVTNGFSAVELPTRVSQIPAPAVACRIWSGHSSSRTQNGNGAIYGCISNLTGISDEF